MGWRDLLFANWPITPEIVAPHLPDELTVDTYDGKGWLSIVPFTNVDLRPTWAPSGTGISLPELNLRTYVRYGDSRGVYFFSLEADGILGVLGARIFHHLPYYWASISVETDSEVITFESQRRHPGARSAHFSATCRPGPSVVDAPTGSLESFLTERYRYFTEDHRGRLRFAQISHDPWQLQSVEVDITGNSIFGANRFDVPSSEPVFFFSEGVNTIASPSEFASQLDQ